MSEPASHTPPDDAPVLDRESALETTAGDVELADLLLTTCIEDAPNIISSAKTAIAESDWGTARRSGHSLKSSFAAVGAMAASASSEKLEFEESDDAGSFSTAIASIEAAYDKLVAHVSR